MGFAIYWSGTTVSSTVSRIQDCAPAAILLLLGRGTNNVLYLGCSFQKARNFTASIVSYNLHLIVFGANNQGRNHGRKVELAYWNWLSPWHACCLLGYTRPREPTNERSSHQNAWFSIWVFINISGVIPWTPTAGGGDLFPHPTPARQASAPVLGPKLSSPSTFQPWLSRETAWSPSKFSLFSLWNPWGIKPDRYSAGSPLTMKTESGVRKTSYSAVRQIYAVLSAAR